MKTGRAVLVLLAALLIAVQIVRNASSEALAEASPARAAKIWRGDPDAEIALGMTQIAQAAHDRKPVAASILTMMAYAARKAPLAAEPFLVRGVQAQLSGDANLATQAFAAAAQRDPRSLPAHYFLADSYLRAGDARRGLEEVGLLSRLAPNGAQSAGPYIAAYAKDRSTWPRLRRLFASDINLESAALTAMATDPANADAVVALAEPRLRTGDATWVATLLNSLIAAGDYAKAKSTWAWIFNLRSASPVHDPNFRDATSSAPFNWALTSSTVGLAERQPGGKLHLIYYGQEDGILARQMILLPPGRYRLSIAGEGNVAQARSLTWSVRCDKAQTPFAALPLDVAVARSWSFTVPASCPAQWLELSGVSSDGARQTDVAVSRLSLTAEHPDG